MRPGLQGSQRFQTRQASMKKQMEQAKACVLEACLHLLSQKDQSFRLVESIWSIKDTPQGLPATIMKLGSYSGGNSARDFRRMFKTPVDWGLKTHNFDPVFKFECMMGFISGVYILLISVSDVRATPAPAGL